MKFACFADLHAHNFKEFDTKSNKTGSSRLDRIIDVLEFIRDDCERQGITHILFAGDLFHVRARVNTVVYNSVYDCIKTFKDHGLEILMIPGNHDDHDNSDLPQHSLHPFKDIEGVTVVDTLKTIEFGGVPIVCVRYSKNAQMIKDFINSLDPSQFNIKPILLGHAGISGAFVGNGNYAMADAFTAEDFRPELFHYLIFGHFHKKQKIAPYNHFMYTGAPIQHNIGDSGEDKGYLIIDTEKECDIQFVPIPSPEFIIADLFDVANKDMKDVADQGDYVILKVKENEVDVALSYLPENLHYRLILEREYQEKSRMDVQVGMTEEQVVQKYAEENSPESLAIGLRILREVKENGN